MNAFYILGEEPFPVGIVAGAVSSVVALGIGAAIGFFVLRRLRTKGIFFHAPTRGRYWEHY
jgi:hypothetical protein